MRRFFVHTTPRMKSCVLFLLLKGLRVEYTFNRRYRLAYFFGTSEAFWMGLQDDYDLEEAHSTLKDSLKQIIRPLNHPV